MEEELDTFLTNRTYTTPRHHGQTPSWMTEQRNKRTANRRIYGGLRRMSRLGFGDDGGTPCDSGTSTTAKRFPRRSKSLRSNSPDLNSSREEVTVKTKKMRGEEGRPPLPKIKGKNGGEGKSKNSGTKTNGDGESVYGSKNKKSSHTVNTNNTDPFAFPSTDMSTPAHNTRRRVLHRSQSATVAASAASAALLLENVHPNDSSERRSTKKRTASITTEVKASPPKTHKFSNSARSFSHLARETPRWGSGYAISKSYATPGQHYRTLTEDWSTSLLLSPSTKETSENTRVCELTSPTEETKNTLVCELTSPPRNTDMDIIDLRSSSSDDSSVHSTSSEESIHPVCNLSDMELYRSANERDLNYLHVALKKWKKSGTGQGCQCQIVLPKWGYERKCSFVKWAAGWGFKSSNLGGGRTMLRCLEREGLEILKRVEWILGEVKAGRLRDGGADEVDETMTSKASVTTSSKPSAISKPTKPPSAFPFCEDNEDEELAESFEKQVTIQKTKKAAAGNTVPSLRRSISLQPLARAIKSPLPMIRRPRLSTEHDQVILDDRKAPLPPPRLSTESAMSNPDFLSQLHGAGPFSPIADFSSKIRRTANRMLNPKRPSLDNKPRLSFESCRNGKPYESPHPNNYFVDTNTPLPRADYGDRPWETPMPKQVEHWGSQPIAGRDWGDSTGCDAAALRLGMRVFAQSWFQSEFYNNADLCDSYKMSFPEEEQSSMQECCTDSEMEMEEEYDAFDFSPEAPPSRKSKLRREDSVGGSAMALLHLDDDTKESNPSRKPASRRSLKLRKYRRMSLCAAASDFLHPKRCLQHSNSPKKLGFTLPDASIMNDIVSEGPILTSILSFFDQAELLHGAFLVCTTWADAAAEALGNLMIASVGCDDADDDVETPRDSVQQIMEEAHPEGLKSSSVAKSMERDWSYFDNFSTGQFLSEGAFKKVFKVWNRHQGVYEALSVMDVNAISDTGNLHTVGAELAVSSLLSSMARRGIAPNFVITRGVFTCQHDLPTNDWDNAGEVLDTANVLEQGECGNFQYIRMEMCKHEDTEEYIRKLPNNMLAPLDCRNLLFQMAFALHVAGDKLGMKHYDVKLLNFFLQSALDDSTPENLHPHVVLRYGVGSSVFRLRMASSTALIVKLADYGTSVLGSDSDGQPISIGQFTTFENTPPDYLILGNEAKQGYSHDCFGLGLCMLHLFTGHCPYEEILKDVVCPDILKTKLRKIWNSPTHDIIASAMMYEDSDGTEEEDETFYDTLYRFIVLFGMPKRKIKHEGSGKVRRAINCTLLKDDSPAARIFESDRSKFSLADGSNEIIANARRRLEEMDGAMDLLLSLVCFDPIKRATPLDVINSKFMAGLVELNDSIHDDRDIVRSYMSYYLNT